MEGGTTRGANLFHSFQTFGVPTGTTVRFNQSEAIANIFSRVTGGQVSQIDGTLAANGQANLFIINPRGIVIGANAQLDLGGALLLSTADSLVFSDRLEFSATNPQPLLSVNVPLGLQLSQAGTITVEGNGRSDPDLDRRFLPVSLNPTGLQTSNPIALLGGNSVLQGAQIFSPQIELGAVTQGTVGFDLGQWQFDYQAINQPGSLQINQASLLSSSKINLFGGDLAILAGSILVAQNQAFSPDQKIKITSDQLTISGVQSGKAFNVSGIITEGISQGKAGDIEVVANNLLVNEGANLTSRSFNLAPGGNINLNIKNQVQVNGAVPNNPVAVSVVGNLALGLAPGGNLTVTTDRLQVSAGANLNASTFSPAQGGNLRLVATDSVTVAGVNPFLPSAIVANTFNQGNGGNLEILTANLQVLDGARVSAATGASGNAGNLTINANQSIQVRGEAPNFRNPSQIDSSANIVDQVTQDTLGLPPIPSGNAGSVMINTPQLQLSDRAAVSVRNEGTGNPGMLQINSTTVQLQSDATITAVSNQGGSGQIKINTQDLTLKNSGIVSATLEAGNGADIEINATGTVDLTGNGLLRLLDTLFSVTSGDSSPKALETVLNFGILTSSFGSGDAGNLSLSAENLQLGNGGVLSTATVGSGNAGNLKLAITNTIRLDDSLISTNTSSRGNAGNIQVQAAKVYATNGGLMTSTTVGSGRAGNINVEATELLDFAGARLSIPVPSLFGVLLNLRAGLAATSVLGTGSAGDIFVKAPTINLRDQAGIGTSAFGFAFGGDIQINTDQLNLSNGAVIAGQSVVGDGGNVGIRATQSLISRGGIISAAAGGETFGGGAGGNIKISSPVVVLLDQTEISADAFAGAGGNIVITTQRLLTDQLSMITASSSLGVDGQIQINSPDLDATGGLVKFSEELVDLSKLIDLGCGSRGNFVYTGRGGLPTNVAESWRLSLFSRTKPQPTLEATGWYRRSDGQVQLVSEASSSGRQFKSPTCLP